MAITDIAIVETENGGDLVLVGNDLMAAEGVSNQLYLACYGGAAWHGNVYMGEEDGVQLKAETESVINSTPLNSAGRLEIQAAMERDLQYVADRYPKETMTITARIGAVNRVDTEVRFGEQIVNVAI